MLVIVGKSATFKTTIEQRLKKDGYSNIVSYTTRPMRIGEADGINYHYISEDLFHTLYKDSFFAEHVSNYGNYYGVAKEDCVDDSLVVVEKNGLKQLNKVDGLDIFSVYLYASPIERFKRMFSRGDKVKDILKRIFTDDIKFLGAKKQCSHIIKAKNSTETTFMIDYLYSEYLEERQHYD